MMKIFFILIFMMIYIYKIEKNLLQMFFQNMFMLVFFFQFLQFSFNNLNMWMKIYFFLGIDYYSLGLILLSIWLLVLMILVSNLNLLINNYYYYYNLILILLITLILCFSVFNLMLFYIFFEISLIPIFLMIMGWGLYIDRIRASMYMMLYTLFGSMPLFLIIIYLYLLNNSLMMDMLLIKNFNFIIYFVMIFAFLIKMPMYFVHLWLPKAHVEAPIMGSMILAGVMLKLGSYGLMRMLFLMMEMCLSFNKFIMIISLMGSIYSSLVCLYQVDMKMLIAYSSVVHMGILISGLMTMFNWGILGGYLMMIAHGLCSSGLFCLVNFNYERIKSRSLMINKGLINYFPSLSLMWFLMCSSNLSFPPSLNLFSEIMLLNGMIIWSKLIIILLIIMLFLSASYTLYIYSSSQHGKIILLSFSLKSLKVMDYLIILLHWGPLNILFMYMYMFI